MVDAEMRRMSEDDWLRRFRSWGVRPSKSMGQNFLLDTDIVERITDAADISSGQLVIEVGPGMGILSEALLNRGAHVIAIEMDDDIASRIADHFRQNDNYTVIHKNAATTDMSAITNGRTYDVVANLPYSVATLIVRHFLESPHPPRRLTIMVQKEVAARMAAGTGDLSLLTLATRLYATPTLLFDVPKDAFYPPPKVTSSVIQLNVRETPLVDSEARSRLFTMATIAFQQRRKTLLNSLSRGLSLDKPTVADELDHLGIDPAARPQAISLESWLALSESTVLQP
ncbi:MAG: ribosomal RNA small subunit methyltransferase A [Chloroflexia bacterium]|jgi:16S rRNA (adenine1518-N6/adenine1519-N6)-dimethyltransferase|nr:ribosomal RNA small subunit methyltransferase A [Chloroflexia bacterium]